MIFTALTPDFFMLRSRSLNNGIATSTVGIPHSMFISSIEDLVILHSSCQLNLRMYILITVLRSTDSRLLLVEHVQEYGHTQACQQMNQRYQHRHRSNRTSRKRRDVTDEAQRQHNGQQYHADQGEQRRTLEGHGGSIAPTFRPGSKAVVRQRFCMCGLSTRRRGCKPSVVHRRNWAAVDENFRSLRGEGVLRTS